ncbi:c-type cytochrome [Roseibium sp. RKSG952]|uniref:c-type cytochrome n=1 Tax=Roseibium sp. RKSG952 TaxID=2529384 RepID=UPI0012BC1A78|nr:cytochrome c [Roseibium sp. RKSG952]MTI03400.1 cytochrome c [Roseibium sp. RKSG952]
MNKSVAKWVSLAAVVIIVTVTGWGLSGRAQNSSSLDTARGADLYAENCASCHGANLEGQPDWQTPDPDGVLRAPPHDRTGHTWHHGDKLLFDYTKLGGEQTLKQMGVTNVKSGMPGFGDNLSDQDIWDILAFIKDSWPDRERKLQEQRTEAEQVDGN